MSRKLSLTIALLMLFSLSVADVADAGVADNAGSVLALSKRAAAIEDAQYYSVDDDNYCWYDGGWQGPGWYWCGYEWDSGLGWWAPYGWNGWDGRHRNRRHGVRVGTWHPGAPTHGLGRGAGLKVMPHSGSGLPGFGSGGAPASRGFGGASAAVEDFTASAAAGDSMALAADPCLPAATADTVANTSPL